MAKKKKKILKKKSGKPRVIWTTERVIGTTEYCPGSLNYRIVVVPPSMKGPGAKSNLYLEKETQKNSMGESGWVIVSGSGFGNDTSMPLWALRDLLKL